MESNMRKTRGKAGTPFAFLIEAHPTCGTWQDNEPRAVPCRGLEYVKADP